jgi:hypothetical protein
MTDNQRVHYWIIDSPDGRESEGTCRKCGDFRMFQNRMPDGSDYWQGKGSRSRQRGTRNGHLAMGHQVDTKDAIEC